MRPLDHRDDIAARPAWSVRRNPRGVVITLLPNCRPDRVINGSYDRWERAMRAKMTPAAFDRQYGLNWSTPVGEAFYAEALEHLHEHAPGEFSGWYVREPTGFMPHVPVLVGHDFGFKRNGCMIAQYDDPKRVTNGRPGSGLLWYYRELRMTEMVCHEACAVGRYMTARATLVDLKREGHTDAYAYVGDLKLTPWLSVEMARRLRFLDYGGDQEKEHRSGLANSKEELSWGAQFKKQGIHVRGVKQNWTHAETVMRHLLRESRHAGVPRMLISPRCTWWLRGLAGGLVVAPVGQRMGGYKRDEEFEDVADMAHYIAQAVYRSRDLAPLEESDAKARATPRRSNLTNERITPAPTLGRAYARPWTSID